MRQVDVQEGGIYLSKGKGMRRGKRVRVEEIVQDPRGKAKLAIVDLDTGRKTYPNAHSFQQSYIPEKLPNPIVNQVAAKLGRSPKGAHGNAAGNGNLPSAVGVGKFDVSEELEALKKVFEAGVEAIERLRRKLS